MTGQAQWAIVGLILVAIAAWLLWSFARARGGPTTGPTSADTERHLTSATTEVPLAVRCSSCSPPSASEWSCEEASRDASRRRCDDVHVSSKS